MNKLADLLSSQVKAEMFRLLFGVRDERLHLRELARQSGLAVGTVRQELTRLTRLGVVESEAESNRTYYRANAKHPLYPGITSLVFKTVGVVDVLRETLREAPVRVAFIFGSAARSPEQLKLELIVIGPISQRQLETRLAEAAEAAGRGLRSYLLTVEQFRRRRRGRAAFLTKALAARRLFIVGDNRSLSEL